MQTYMAGVVGLLIGVILASALPLVSSGDCTTPSHKTQSATPPVQESQIPSSDPISIEKLSCVEDNMGNPAAVIKVTNHSPELVNLYIEIGFYDASGTVLSTGNALEDVPANSSSIVHIDDDGYPSIGWQSCKIIDEEEN